MYLIRKISEKRKRGQFYSSLARIKQRFVLFCCYRNATGRLIGKNEFSTLRSLAVVVSSDAKLVYTHVSRLSVTTGSVCAITVDILTLCTGRYKCRQEKYFCYLVSSIFNDWPTFNDVFYILACQPCYIALCMDNWLF